MSDKNTYWYCIPADCPESFYRFETIWDIGNECRYVFEDAAENFFNDHDGWEHSWPIEFTLHDSENGTKLAQGTVDLFHQPEFHASEYETDF